MRFVLPGVMKMQELLDQLAAALRYANAKLSSGESGEIEDETIGVAYGALTELRDRLDAIEDRKTDLALAMEENRLLRSHMDELSSILDKAEAELHRLGR